MSYTQDQIDRLENAIALGVTTVKHGETTTIYRSLSEMKSILADMKASVNGNGSLADRRSIAAYRSGF